MHVTGACHCGAVTFSAEVDEAKVMLCHCTDCQVLSASAFRVGAIVLRDTFAIRGPTKEYRKIGTSGSVRIQVFCPECATGIYSYTPGDAGPYISLRLGGVHQRAELAPRLQLWRRSALPWIDRLADVPGCAEQEAIAAMIPRREGT
jgi:hypothetical protein